MNSYTACEEMRTSLICPKPRRIGHRSAAADPTRLHHRWHNSHETDPCDSGPGVDFPRYFPVGRFFAAPLLRFPAEQIRQPASPRRAVRGGEPGRDARGLAGTRIR
ncbi:uncharacterized protein M6B38_108350 [Iris pallida]|uniref:Uncharacterized protein n=1 Tax=Iris pallida TaxID=29817 RepID=A0AAX6EHB0_IRIPA|nr:uncharacterized protein M6B38_108350 [Iris pallida]